ncbi:hypothetical protein B0T14DRAFT_553013 [Immersiella caudata]|uniref:CBM-cenC domain-containing protein n=1 Tax=Immersiella caudata TaxID=314043 RepID=A0AA39WVY1_9PEZI|nr:hypothetical protein B0T14DRAFT_553013 [Immersiella caudata]
MRLTSALLGALAARSVAAIQEPPVSEECSAEDEVIECFAASSSVASAFCSYTVSGAAATVTVTPTVTETEVVTITDWPTSSIYPLHRRKKRGCTKRGNYSIPPFECLKSLKSAGTIEDARFTSACSCIGVGTVTETISAPASTYTVTETTFPPWKPTSCEPVSVIVSTVTISVPESWSPVTSTVTVTDEVEVETTVTATTTKRFKGKGKGKGKHTTTVTVTEEGEDQWLTTTVTESGEDEWFTATVTESGEDVYVTVTSTDTAIETTTKWAWHGKGKGPHGPPKTHTVTATATETLTSTQTELSWSTETTVTNYYSTETTVEIETTTAWSTEVETSTAYSTETETSTAWSTETHWSTETQTSTEISVAWSTETATSTEISVAWSTETATSTAWSTATATTTDWAVSWSTETATSTEISVAWSTETATSTEISVAWSTTVSVTATTTTTTATVTATPTWSACIKNGGFENPSDPDYGWTWPSNNSNKKVEIVGAASPPSAKKGSDGSIKALSLWSQNNNKASASQTIDCIPNTKYLLIFDVIEGSGTHSSSVVKAFIGGAQITDVSNANIGAAWYPVSTTFTCSSNTKIELEVTAPSNQGSSVRQATYLFDGFQAFPLGFF